MEIKREDFAWGVRLTGRPFAALGNAAMFIGADITPRPNRNPDIRVQFTGAIPPNTVKMSDVAIWVNNLHAIIERARVIAAEMKATDSKPPKRVRKR